MQVVEGWRSINAAAFLRAVLSYVHRAPIFIIDDDVTTGRDRRKPRRVPGANGLRLPHVALRLDPDGQPHGILSVQPCVLGVQTADEHHGALR